MQQVILEREREAQDKITQQGQELAELRKAGGTAAELASVLDHFTPNLPPHVAELPRVQQIAQLFAASEALDRDPVSSIKHLAAQYGIDLAQLAYDPQAEAQRQQVTAQHQQAYQALHAQQQQWQYQRE